MLLRLFISCLAFLAILPGTIAVAAAPLVGTAQGAPTPGRSTTPGSEQVVLAPESGSLVKLAPVEVRSVEDGDSEFDETGMGSYERQFRDWPFANDLVMMEPVHDEVVDAQVAQIANPSAVDLATGDSRLHLRGFPTPLLRNGFVTMGAADMLNTSRTVVIQGALVPVLGRAAPGGIQDFWTARPRTSPTRRFEYSISTLRMQSAAAEIVGVAIPKRAWHRVSLNWSRRKGPAEFAVSETYTANAAVSWKHSKTASTVWAVDVQEVRANAAPGVPEYRTAPGQKIIGPYLPLASFNAFGPDAGVRRRTGAFTAWFDGQPHPRLIVRAGVEAWWRTVEQDRFTTGLYNVATARFEGTREPRHMEQPQTVVLGHIELTRRFSTKHTEHKLMAAVSHTEGTYSREEVALSPAARNALPESVRLFRPDAPNYYRVPFDRDVYSRVLTDREERARYTALELTERMGTSDGRVVIATGLRQDFVGLDLIDRRPGTTLPRVEDRVGQLTYHLAANYQALPGRLLVFATTSTAFEPSTRVDIRTGRIQGNDTTRGYESGLKGRFRNGRVVMSASAFLLYNQDISRRNPLYDDPIFDANQTQPQLVAAGEERFSGGKVEGRWTTSGPWSFSARAAYTRAVTTASPDLPQEVGRAITRLPPYTASASATYAVQKGRLTGLSLSGTWSYISSYVARYEDSQRYALEYPGYGLVSLSGNWSVRRKKVTHNIRLSVRNAGQYDMLSHQAIPGSQRDLSASYRVAL